MKRSYSVKTLQVENEQTRILAAFGPLTFHEKPASDTKSIVLLLHGLDERGLRIMRKLLKYLPDSALVLAPNGPYPLPRPKADRIDYGYAWYFYDRFTQNYHVDQTLSLSLLKSFLAEKNPHNLPVTIIGFSQGGYLAPLLAYEDANIKTVIGIGCEFRERFFSQPPSFRIFGLHGDQDNIVSPEHSRQHAQQLLEKNISVDWRLIPGAAHEINQAIGQMVQGILEDAK
jgi:predicted esterase